MSIPQNSKNPILDTQRHSVAHLMAAAVKQHFNSTELPLSRGQIEDLGVVQFGVGPVIETGCYYDFILPRTLIPEDLPLIENKMRDFLNRDLAYKVQELSLQDAILLFENQGQTLKVELLNDLATRGTTSMSEEEKADFENIPLLRGGSQSETGWKFNYSKLPKNKDLQDNAQNLKKAGVLSEVIFWQTFKEKNLLKWDIDRQVIIGNYFVDFFIPELGLVFEIDGESHDFKGSYDEQRETFLTNLDLKIVHFSDLEIKNDINSVTTSVLGAIRQRIEELKSTPSADAATPQEGNLPKITIYRIVDEKTGEILFEDLCKGPHIQDISELKNIGFKLDKFSGSYWRGDQARNIQMQRIYALVYSSPEDLEKFINDREEAKKRDHRILGQQLEIYTISDDVGAGLPIYLPNGAIIRQLLEKYCYQEAQKSGYQYVYTPHIGKSDLFAKSGHLDHYADGMYAPIDMVNLKGEGVLEGGKTEKFYLKPMNCPMHHQVYLNRPRSYKELPYRLYEYGTVYRYEESGTLTGMIRVRGFTQNDAHVYCQTNQLKEVIEEALNRMIKTYKDVGIGEYKIRFSLPDFLNEKEKFGEETEEWINSVSAMRQALDELGVDYYEAVGEAAFYGPKIDIQVKNVNGKEDSLSTIQVDYSIAPKFGITFTNSQGQDEVPAIIHMALMGSVDRFMAFMLEMTGGRLPFWLAPAQVKILTVNNQEIVMDYVDKIKSVLADIVLMKPLKYNELRFEVDDRNESLGKKIREAETQKIPVILIVGPKDIESGQVSVRAQNGEEKVSLDGLKNYLESIK
jgi:threonyl-tRNA synthetase